MVEKTSVKNQFISKLIATDNGFTHSGAVHTGCAELLLKVYLWRIADL